MTNNFITPQHNRAEDNRSREDEAFFEAIKVCDDDTYNAVTSILREAGLLPE